MKNFKKIVIPVALSASLITLSGCSNGEKYISSKAGDVTQAEVLDYIGKQQVSKAATDVIIKKVLLEKYKNKIDNKYIDSQYADTEKQYGGKEQFESALKQQGFTQEKYKEALKMRAAQAYMINDFAKVTEDKIKEKYEKEKTQYNLAHILISVKGDTAPNGLSDEDAKAKAEEILEKVKKGDDFATLAKENSTDTSNAANGGELGWSSKESTSFVKEFADVAYSLKKGEVSTEVVKTPFGYHIIKVLDTKELTFEEAKQSIVEKIAQEEITKDSSLYNKALEELFKEYDVKGNTEDVKTYLKDMLSHSKDK